MIILSIVDVCFLKAKKQLNVFYFLFRLQQQICSLLFSALVLNLAGPKSLTPLVSIARQCLLLELDMLKYSMLSQRSLCGIYS